MRGEGAGWARGNASGVEEAQARSAGGTLAGALGIRTGQAVGVTGDTLLLHWIFNIATGWAIAHTGRVEEG